jgi:hypothetical protein
MEKRKAVVVSTFRNSTKDAIDVLDALVASQEALSKIGYKIGVCFTDDNSEDETYVDYLACHYFDGFALRRNAESRGRGYCFIEGLREALIGLDDDDVIVLADLCGKAPHDPMLFIAHLSLLKGCPSRIIVGSTRYETLTRDDCEMRAMGALQYYKFGADGEPFNIQSPALQIGRVEYFRKALEFYDIYVSSYPKYTDEPFPGPGVPGVLLRMLSFAGAKLHGVTLPVFGEWRPSRIWEQLQPHMQGTILHAEIAEVMQKDGLFDS